MTLTFYSFDPHTKQATGTFTLDTSNVKAYTGKMIFAGNAVKPDVIPVKDIDFSKYGGEFATLIQPPEVTEDQLAVFRDGSWQVILKSELY